MVQLIAAKDVMLRELKQNFGLQMAEFFSEWREGLRALSSDFALTRAILYGVLQVLKRLGAEAIANG